MKGYVGQSIEEMKPSDFKNKKEYSQKKKIIFVNLNRFYTFALLFQNTMD